MSRFGRHPGIVVGVDGSPGSKIAIRWAARDAELRNVALTLAHVLPTTAGTRLSSSLAPQHTGKLRERGQQLLEEALQIANESCQRGPNQINLEMPSGTAVSALVDMSKNADLLVVGYLGTGTLRGRHLGSVSAGLIYHSHCPVVVIHDDVDLNPDRERSTVLVGIDGSPTSELAIALAFDEASRRKVDLTVVHTWQPPNVFDPIVGFPGPGWRTLRSREDQIVAERLAGWTERYPDVAVHRIIARNNAAPELVDSSTQAQLVVIGSHGSGGFTAMLFGSVSAAVVLLTHVPVMIARRSPPTPG